MPFETRMRPYTMETILSLKPTQQGVYGIFSRNLALYIGSDDIQERMLAHIDGDNPCVAQNAPDQWTASVISDDPTSIEAELIWEYEPICNRAMRRKP